MELLDKSSYIPYYVQIKHILMERIQSGVYLQDSRIPSETELSKQFAVTRMTVRKALDELKREGVISTERGKGSKVSPAKIEQSLRRFYKFGKEIGDTGIAAESKLIRAGECNLPSEISRVFLNQKDDRFFEIIRIRYYKDIPVSLESSYIPYSAAPGILDENIESVSLVELLEKKFGNRIEKATEYLHPRISDEYESNLLKIHNHTPVFQTERITKTKNGEVVEFRRSIIRGDIVSFSTELY